MRKITSLLIFLLIACNAYGGNSDFRDVSWGMSRVEVLAAEKIKPLKVTDEYISYKVNFFGEKIFLLYEFVLNNLLSARYVYENPDMGNVQKIFEVLEKKYVKKESSENINFFENEKTLIKVEYNENYLKIYYKSKEIDKIDKKYNEKIKDDEKKYLLSIF